SGNARTRERSVRTPTGLPASTTGITSDPVSRNTIAASTAVLKGVQVRGPAGITSATVSIGLTRSDSDTSGTGSGCDSGEGSQACSTAAVVGSMIRLLGPGSGLDRSDSQVSRRSPARPWHDGCLWVT